MWSRYTEVTGKESSADNTTTEIKDDISGIMTIPLTLLMAVNGIIILRCGFMFFNYEKALRTTSFISRFIDTISFEKYFGQKILNNLFEMTGIRVRTAC